MNELKRIWQSALKFYRETIEKHPDYVAPVRYGTEQPRPSADGGIEPIPFSRWIKIGALVGLATALVAWGMLLIMPVPRPMTGETPAAKPAVQIQTEGTKGVELPMPSLGSQNVQ